MSTDFHALITRMANELDEYQRMLLDDCTVTHWLSDEARAALADEPAAPEGRELAAVTGQPSDEELVKLAQHCSVVYLWSDGSACTPFQDGYDLRGELIAFARALLTRWGSPAPAPPADGEVAELVETLKGIAYWKRHGRPGDSAPAPFGIRQADRLDRAAELLQRQALVPASVSERLPKLGDCDAEERCWWWYPPVPEQTYGYWAHEDDAIPERSIDEQPTHWLPAHALPLPEVGK